MYIIKFNVFEQMGSSDVTSFSHHKKKKKKSNTLLKPIKWNDENMSEGCACNKKKKKKKRINPDNIKKFNSFINEDFIG